MWNKKSSDGFNIQNPKLSLMKKLIFLLSISLVFLLNCTTTSPGLYSNYQASGYSSDDPILARSLFASDQSVISQAAIDTILSSKIVLPDNSKLALINFSGHNTPNSSIYGYGYWRSEAYLKLQQSYIDTLTSKIESSDKIKNVSLLPSLLTPQNPTIPILREAAVRLQAPILLVYRINSDIYQEYRVFKAKKSKAYATVEIVLLDVRTGIIPFTAISTKEYQSTKNRNDTSDGDFLKRTERVAVNYALEDVAEQLIEFLHTN